MIVFVIGGSGSGKSAYAEKRLLAMEAEKKHYIATMRVFDEEGKKRVEKHRTMRREKGFLTIEKPIDLGEIALDAGDAWMLECGGGRLYGDGEGSSCSVNRKLTAIEALADMLGHMKRGVMFDLKINEINIANYINRGFLGKWKQNGWKTVGGARVKYAEEWKKVRFEPHAFRAEYVHDLEIPA